MSTEKELQQIAVSHRDRPIDIEARQIILDWEQIRKDDLRRNPEPIIITPEPELVDFSCAQIVALFLFGISAVVMVVISFEYLHHSAVINEVIAYQYGNR